jgi:hypothetical protein
MSVGFTGPVLVIITDIAPLLVLDLSYSKGLTMHTENESNSMILQRGHQHTHGRNASCSAESLPEPVDCCAR